MEKTFAFNGVTRTLTIPEGMTPDDIARYVVKMKDDGIFDPDWKPEGAPESAPEASTEEPAAGSQEQGSSLAGLLKMIAEKVPEVVYGVGKGVGENFPFPGAGKMEDKVTRFVTGGSNPAREQMQEYVKGSPTAQASESIGEELPGLVRSIATFQGGMGALPTLLNGGKVANVANSVGRNAIASLLAGQASDPSLDPTKIALDAGIGGALGGAGEVAKEASGPVRRFASRMYKTVLKRPAARMEAEAAAGRVMEDELAKEVMLTPTAGSLARKAGEEVKKIAPKIDAVIDHINYKVHPSRLVKNLEAMKKEMKLVGPRGEVIPGEQDTVKAIDAMIDEVKMNYLPNKGFNRSFTPREAQELKQTFWSRANKVFENTKISDVTSEGQASMGRAMREGLEESASKTTSGAGERLAALNKKEGMWLEAGKAAKKAEPRIDKAFLGRYIAPLVLGAGAGGSAAFGGPEELTAPLAIAAYLSTPGGRLLSGNASSAIAKLLEDPKMLQMLTPLLVSQTGKLTK